MATPSRPVNILRTKLFIPKNRQPVVPRPRLVARLNEGTQQALTLLSTPAGFGKTTLLAEWAQQTHLPLAWISLDEQDNNPARWIAYLLAALDGAVGLSPDTLALAQAAQSAPVQSVLDALFSELATLADPFALILDDYHAITALPVHEALAFLLSHQPPQLRLVIATRADPPVPLARLRSRRELVELRAEDLRFTAAETAVFLNGLVGLSLSEKDVQALEARTEGWIAGLQMAALSMQGREDIAGFIRSFSGSHRFILDYLAEEVLARQPENVQRFLLDTSILARLNGPLCDTVTTGSGSQQMLEGIEKANLFLVPLDDERHWFRYHHLFADLLQIQLRQTSPERIPALHLRAAEWFEAAGFPLEAVQHAFAAQDYERAADLIELHGQARWAASDVAFITLGSRLPPEMLTSRPNLGILQAWTLILYGQLRQAEALLKDLRQAIPEGEADPKLEPARAFIDLALAYIEAFRPGSTQIRLPDRLALEFVPEEFLGMRNTVEVIYAMLLSWRGEFEPAIELLQTAVERDRASGGTTAIPISISMMTRLRMIQGRLREAAALCRAALQEVDERGKWRFYTAGSLDLALSEILLEWNALEAAERQIREGIGANNPWQIPTTQAMGSLALARVQAARGDLDGALATLKEAEGVIGDRTVTPDIAVNLRVLTARLRLVRGDPTTAQSWADSPLPAGTTDAFIEPERILQARARLAAGNPVGAISLLEGLAGAARTGGRHGRLLQISLLKAVALAASGRLPEALADLQTSLALGEPEGYLRSFIEEGEPLRGLLGAYLRQPTAPQAAYAHKILQAFSGPDPLGPAQTPIQTGLVEPLTRRELEVLQMLSQGDSNAAIAARLVLSLGTVKKHTSNIFGKLGVSNRTQAVARARQLGLLQPDLS